MRIEGWPLKLSKKNAKGVKYFIGKWVERTTKQRGELEYSDGPPTRRGILAGFN
jgi:hypothetical protein